MGKLMYISFVKKRTGLLLVFSLCVGILVGDRMLANSLEEKGIRQHTTLEKNAVDLTVFTVEENCNSADRAKDLQQTVNTLSNKSFHNSVLLSESFIHGKEFVGESLPFSTFLELHNSRKTYQV